MIKISVANLRRSLAEMLSLVRYAEKTIIIYWHQKPWAVIISFDQAEKMNIVQRDEK